MSTKGRCRPPHVDGLFGGSGLLPDSVDDVSVGFVTKRGRTTKHGCLVGRENAEIFV